MKENEGAPLTNNQRQNGNIVLGDAEGVYPKEILDNFDYDCRPMKAAFIDATPTIKIEPEPKILFRNQP